MNFTYSISERNFLRTLKEEYHLKEHNKIKPIISLKFFRFKSSMANIYIPLANTYTKMSIPIETNNAPAPGNYSQAIKVSGPGDLVFLSGQLGVRSLTQDPRGSVAPGGVGPQTEQALHNLEGVLAAAGGNLKDIVRTTVYLTDFKTNLDEFDRAYSGYFHERGIQDLPARSLVPVSESFSRGRLVQIEATAFIPPKPSYQNARAIT